MPDGRIAQIGDKIDPGKDKISFEGKRIEAAKKKIYIMLNKPAGYLVSKSDTRGRKLAHELLKVPSVNGDKLSDLEQQTLFNVGRLDLDTEGLLLFTNDGEFALRLAHPRYHVKKTYIAKVKGRISNKAIDKLKRGLTIKVRDGHKLIEYKTLPAEVRVLGRGKEEYSVVVIRIREGRKRQVRRMFDAVNYPVLTLKRIQVGTLKLEDLPLGKWRFLTADEIAKLKTK
ncbi:MAG: pseudouridine synthase [Candidatus Nanoarchaeia archaeon]